MLYIEELNTNFLMDNIRSGIQNLFHTDARAAWPRHCDVMTRVLQLAHSSSSGVVDNSRLMFYVLKLYIE